MDPFSGDPNAPDKDRLTCVCDGILNLIAIVASISTAPIIRSGTRVWDLWLLD